MYAVITGEKTFTLLPPTDILYLEEKEVQSMQYEVREGYSANDKEEACSGVSNPQDCLILDKRLKKVDLRLTSSGCPTDSLTWICTDPDDPEVLTKHPNFKYAHPLRCKVQPGEILYIPGE